MTISKEKLIELREEAQEKPYVEVPSDAMVELLDRHAIATSRAVPKDVHDLAWNTIWEAEPHHRNRDYGHAFTIVLRALNEIAARPTFTLEGDPEPPAEDDRIRSIENRLRRLSDRIARTPALSIGTVRMADTMMDEIDTMLKIVEGGDGHG